jgi:hypothetical protein
MTLGSALIFVVLAMVMRTVLNFQVQWGAALGFHRPSLAWSCLFLALTCPLGILIHEWGHYLAGTALKQCCRRFVVGPVELARDADRWAIRWIPLRHAGLVDLVPSTFAGFRRQRGICVLGGPLASLFTGLVFLALSFRARTSSLFWIWSFCAQWALVGLLGLVPIRRGAARSDGYLLWELAQGSAVLDGIQRDLLTPASHATPLRLRDWPHDLILRLADRPADPLVLQRFDAYLAYIHSLDRGEIPVAAQYLDRLMADWTSSDPPEYALEAAYFLALHGGDVATARKWLTLETRDAEPWVRLRARAAVERAAGNPENARTLADEALTALKAAPACGAHQYEIDCVHAVLRGG